MNVPSGWRDITGTPFVFRGEEVGFAVSASPNLKRFDDTFLEPGASFAVSRTLPQRYGNKENLIKDILVDFASAEGLRQHCSSGAGFPFQNGGFTGLQDVWENCRGQQGTRVGVAAALSGDESVVAVFYIQSVGGNFEAEKEILRSARRIE